MSERTGNEKSKRSVLVVGVDLTDVSEHLLSSARQVLRDADEGELHVVHVVPREPLTQRVTHPPKSRGPGEVAGVVAAQWELDRLCAALADGSKVKVVTHTPIGDPAQEVVRVAREVGASLVLVETHDDKRLFHVSVATQIVAAAPCSVLTLRPPRDGLSA
jgi:nucleotide-binding universal stress UspA family protein